MALIHSLNGNDWQIRGYLGMVWQMATNELWGDRPGQVSEWIPATVPGMVQTDLVRAGVIPEPYHELNSTQCEWVSNRDWVYRKSFAVPAQLQGQRIRLRFHGVDYRCRVSLNEHILGEHEGTCLPFEFDVTDQLNYDEQNNLIVAIYRAPDTHSQFGLTTETRHFKPRFSFGWDFAPRVVPLGIWQDVELVATGEVCIKELWPRPEVDEKGKARLGLSVSVAANENVGLQLRIQLTPKRDTFDFQSLQTSGGRDLSRFPDEPGMRPRDAMVSLGFVGEDDIIGVLAGELGMGSIQLTKSQINEDAFSLLNKEILLKYKVIPYEIVEERVRIAIADPFDVQAQDFLRIMMEEKGYGAEFILAREDTIHSLLGVPSQESPEPRGTRGTFNHAEKANFTKDGGIWQKVFDIPEARLWHLNNVGPQPLYTLTVEIQNEDGTILDRQEKTIGFRRLEWVRTEGASKDALPYQPVVNGKTMPVFGWNWVPLDNCYGGEIDDRYIRFVGLAKQAGVNLLRIWGGGIVEKELFYDLCDRAGILVMQEFQLSSSGVDNDLPQDDEFLRKLKEYARQVVPLRRHHPSLGLWCGGNELFDDKIGRPLTSDNPGIAVMKAAVNELDPGRLFLPTSASGPTGMLAESNADDHANLHDIHGPWTYSGPVAHYKLYNRAVMMLHSEFGAPGSTSVQSMRGFIREENLLPHDLNNPVWRHHGRWWVNDVQVREFFGEVDGIEEYVRMSQFLQYEALRYAVESDLRNWPRCAGTIPWQYNEPWPGVSCTCSVDWYGRPKPAYYGVARAYRPVHASLRYSSLIPSLDGEWKGEIFLTTFGDVKPGVWHVEWKCMTLDGREIAGRSTRNRVEKAGTVLIQALPEKVRVTEPMLITLRVYGDENRLEDANDYLFGSRETPWFGKVRGIGKTTLSVEPADAGCRVRNTGSVPALWIGALDHNNPGERPGHTVDWGYFCLAPGEARDVNVEGLNSGERLSFQGWNTQSRQRETETAETAF